MQWGFTSFKDLSFSHVWEDDNFYDVSMGLERPEAARARWLAHRVEEGSVLSGETGRGVEGAAKFGSRGLGRG